MFSPGSEQDILKLCQNYTAYAREEENDEYVCP